MEVIPGIKLGDVVSFSVFENVKAVLPTKFDNVKVVGSLDADSAKALIDPYTLHRNIYPMLAQGTAPDDPTQYYYIKVKLPNGQFTAVGIPWINPTTIEQRDSSTAVVHAILPTRDISRELAELIVECDIPEVDYEKLTMVLLDAALAFNDTNWAMMNDVIHNNLLALGTEIGLVTMDAVPLADVPNLHDTLSNLAVKLYRTMVALELDRFNNDPNKDWPCITILDMSHQGDLVVEICG